MKQKITSKKEVVKQIKKAMEKTIQCCADCGRLCAERQEVCMKVRCGLGKWEEVSSYDNLYEPIDCDDFVARSR